MKALIAEAAQYGISISLAHIAEVDPEILGYYDHDASEIVVEITLTWAQRRSVLAHELGHAIHCHTCDSDAGERQAKRFAAERLIDPVHYARLEQMSEDTEWIAGELDVTPNVVDDYRRYCLERIGEVTYSRSKMGAGQWDHRELVVV